MKSINILILTYNQEDVIGRALESILCQRQFGLNKIIISDDNSTDNNVQVIERYKNKYPELIDYYVNRPNLGIYGNSNRLLEIKGDADLYYLMAGDDAIVDGLFCNVQKFIKDNNISLEGSSGIFFDWKTINDKGKEQIFDQSIVLGNYSPISLFIRNKLYERGLLISKSLMSKYEPTILNQGLNLAENLFDTQGLRNVGKIYYLPFVGSIYYSGVGISTTLDIDSPYCTTEHYTKCDYFINNILADAKDRNWMLGSKYRVMYLKKPTFMLFFNTLNFYIRGCTSYILNFRDIWYFWEPMFSRTVKVFLPNSLVTFLHNLIHR